MISPIIEFKNISLTYGKKVIFDNFNITIDPYSKVAIFGKSGMGKSTFLKLILGFIKADSGQIYLNQKPICSENIDWVRQQISYVDQDVVIGQGQVKKLIDEYLSFHANQHITPTIEDIENLMHDYELDVRLLHQNVEKLSGGERQRIAIVIALLLKRPVMVLDEVTASLDTHSKQITINNLMKYKNITTITVTHDKEWRKVSHIRLFDFKEKKWVQ